MGIGKTYVWYDFVRGEMGQVTPCRALLGQCRDRENETSCSQAIQASYDSMRGARGRSIGSEMATKVRKVLAAFLEGLDHKGCG